MQSLLLTLFVVHVGFGFYQPDTTQPPSLPQLHIVELVAIGAVSENEFGMKADWLKLQNVGTDTIHLDEHQLFITDNSRRPRKFRLRKRSLGPGDTLVVWCDDQACVRKQVHANFKLSSAGETITLSTQIDKSVHMIDQVHYKAIQQEVNPVLHRSSSRFVVSKP